MPYSVLARRRSVLRRRGHAPVMPVRMMGAARGGWPFLPDVFGLDARQIVEAAFGADLDADPSSWLWVDITRYFLWEAGVEATIGYAASEAVNLQAATLTGRLKNHQGGPGMPGDWSLGNPLSPFWPNVVENLPIRAQLDVGNGPSTRFFGYLGSIPPTRSAGGAEHTVSLTAYGVSRRAGRGRAAAKWSPMYRFHMLSHRFPTSTNLGWPAGDQQYHALPAHYWPLSESNGAVQGENAAVSSLPLLADGPTRVPQFGGDNYLPGPGAMCRFNDGSSLSVALPTITVGGRTEPGDSAGNRGIRLQLLVRLDESAQNGLKSALGSLADSITARALTVRVSIPSIDVQNIVIYFDNDATDGLLCYCDVLDSRGVSVTGSPMGGEIGVPWERGVYFTLDVVRTASATNEVRFGAIPLTTSPTTAFPDAGAIISVYDFQTIGGGVPTITGLALAEGANFGGGSIGQVSIYNGASDTFPDRYPHALLGRTGDSVADRLYRLGVEQNMPIEIVGDCTDIPMGPQGTAGFLDLLGECMAVDQGLLLDGLHPGFTYIARSMMYSRPPALTLDASAGDELSPDTPQHDDQGLTNDYTATSPGGGSQRFVQTDGERGTDAIGTVDSGGQHPAAFGADLYQIAAWRVALGTTPGLRYPRFRFQFGKSTTAVKAQQWLDTLPGAHLRVLGARPGMPNPDLSQLLRGWTENIRSLSYEVTTNGVDYTPYRVAALAADSGDAGDYLGRLEVDAGTVTLGSTTAAEALYDDLESGIGLWTSQNGWTVTAEPAFGRSGAASMKLTPPGATASGGAVTAAGTPVTAGATYLVEAWFWSAAGWSDCRAAVDWYDGAGVFLSSSLGSATVVPAAAWTVSRQTLTAPAGAVTGRPRARQGGTPTAADVLWVDDVTMQPLLQLVTPTGGQIMTNDAVSTYADDLARLGGLRLSIAGLRVRMLGITGTSSPQTLIVNPADLLKPIPTGSPVSIWPTDVVRLGL